MEKNTAVLFIVVPFVFHQRFAGAQGHGEAGVDIPAVSGAKAVSRPRTGRRTTVETEEPMCTNAHTYAQFR